MSGFDVTYTVGSADIAVPTPEAISQGVQPSLQVIVGVAMALPFSAGPGQPPVMVEMGKVRLTFDYDTAKGFFEGGVKALEDLPKPSNLMRATSLQEVENAARNLEKITKGE
jgi:hypothetical protein